jgi:hypothetical protein
MFIVTSSAEWPAISWRMCGAGLQEQGDAGVAQVVQPQGLGQHLAHLVPGPAQVVRLERRGPDRDPQSSLRFGAQEEWRF